MGWIMRFTIVKGSTGILNCSVLPTLFLVQDSTQPYGSGICVHLEWFCKISKGINQGGGAHYLQCIKGFLALLHTLNFLSLIGCIVSKDLIIEGAGNLGIALNEVLIAVHEPQEASQLCNHDGDRPVLDSFNFMTISLDALLGNLVPQINYIGSEELTLSRL